MGQENIDQGMNDSLYHLPQEWAEYLSKHDKHWSWYGHFTFKGYPHPEQADKLWNVFTHRLNREAYGQRYWKNKNKGVLWARGTELQRRGAIHYHALIGDIPDYVNRMKYREWWNDNGGVCMIDQYDVGKGAEFYMCKSAYAFKRGEIDLSDSLTKEAAGCRISAKDLQNEFIAQFTRHSGLRLSQFSW